MRLPDDPQALAAALPDEPRWIETRSLLHGDCILRVSADGQGAVALDKELESGTLIGRADPSLLGETLAEVAPNFELLVQVDALEQARQALPGWTVALVVVHRLPSRYAGEPTRPGVRIAVPPEPRWFEGLPEDFQYAATAHAAAVQLVDGAVVAVCAAGDVTETLWDVGIDTLKDHRRNGYAVACFHALATAMAAQGRQPVWCAYADYPPSIELAAKLGFRPVDQVIVLTRP
ncbi:MAG: hypothetical protein DLM58_07400 [Pseudonocardiales bacterium]|nr:MAG: hypothetical protein DLM58_07400 [Pseudonocardiales bacterium]